MSKIARAIGRPKTPMVFGSLKIKQMPPKTDSGGTSAVPKSSRSQNDSMSLRGRSGPTGSHRDNDDAPKPSWLIMVPTLAVRHRRSISRRRRRRLVGVRLRIHRPVIDPGSFADRFWAELKFRRAVRSSTRKSSKLFVGKSREIFSAQQRDRRSLDWRIRSNKPRPRTLQQRSRTLRPEAIPGPYSSPSHQQPFLLVNINNHPPAIRNQTHHLVFFRPTIVERLGTPKEG